MSPSLLFRSYSFEILVPVKSRFSRLFKPRAIPSIIISEIGPDFFRNELLLREIYSGV